MVTVRPGPDEADDNVVDISDYLQVLRRRKWIVVGGLVLGLLIGLLAAARSSAPSYTATAQVLVRSATSSVANPGVYPDTGVNIATEQRLASSADVAKFAAKRLESDVFPTQLVSGLAVSSQGDSNVLAFSYTAADPDTAELRAQTFADVYLERRARQGEKGVEQAIKTLQGRLDELEDELTEAQLSIIATPDGSLVQESAMARRNFLLQQVSPLGQRIEDLRTVTVRPGSVITPASAAYDADGLSSRNLIAGCALLGLLLGVALAFIRERTDDRLRVPSDVERRLGLPLLASIPQHARPWRREPPVLAAANRADGSTPYGLIVARVLVATRRQELGVLAVTSPVDGADSQVVAANVALALAQAGERVALVEATPMRDSIRQPLQKTRNTGPYGHGRTQSAQQGPPSGGGLRLFSVPEEGKAGAVGQPDAVRRLTEKLRGNGDFVIVIVPPVLAAPDALLLASDTDSVVLVATQNATRRAEVLKAAEQLGEVGARLLGVVVASRGGALSTWQRGDGAGAQVAARPTTQGPAEAV